MNRRVLLIEDEPGLVMTLTDRLESEGFGVESCGDGECGLERASSHAFDLVILDLMLPRLGGMDVCRRLRQSGVETPVLMLTARGQVVDKVAGLRTGADDYVTKPFDMAELMARIHALLRRAPKSATATSMCYRFGGVTVDFRSGVVTRDGNQVALSAREFYLLRYFIQHRGVVVSREDLLREVWEYEALITTRTVDVHVAWLRQKLEVNPKNPEYLLTVRGLGYRFDA